MYTEISHYFLLFTIFTFFLLIFQNKITFFCYFQERSNLYEISFFFIILTNCFFSLINSYTHSDYSICNILMNSNIDTPLFYKISATWSNHEGSLLLWSWLLSFYVFLFCLQNKNNYFFNVALQQSSLTWEAKKYQNINMTDFEIYPLKKKHKVFLHLRISNILKKTLLCLLSQPYPNQPQSNLFPKIITFLCFYKKFFFFESFKILNFITYFFFCFLLYTSNPFLKLSFFSINSLSELNPVLQDPVLAIHPPCIYAGYVASAIGFSLCLYKLPNYINKNNTFKINLTLEKPLKNFSLQIFKHGLYKTYAIYFHFIPNIFIQLRIWILICWVSLTVGILLGSWWAYHELGWGGWWFWDPVENASLMPWLLATASIHSIIQKKFKSWTLSLTMCTFLLSILGTFFVRSGLLASVHSFASDSTKGVAILNFFVFSVFITILRCIQIQHYNLQTSKQIKKTFLEQLIYLQNLFFILICLIILSGTVAPTLFQWTIHRDISIGQKFYNETLIPFFTSLFVLLIYWHYFQFSPQVKNVSQNKTKKQKSLIKKNFLFFEFFYSLQSRSYLFLLFIIHFFLFYFFFQFSILNSLYITLCIYLVSFLIKNGNIFKIIHSFLQPLIVYRQIEDNKKIYNKTKFFYSVPSFFCKYIPTKNLKKKFFFNLFIPSNISHIGLVLFLIGIILSNRFKFQLTQLMHSGSEICLGNKNFCCLRSIDQGFGPNYQSISANFLIYEDQRNKKNVKFFNEKKSLNKSLETQFFEQTLIKEKQTKQDFFDTFYPNSIRYIDLKINQSFHSDYGIKKIFCIFPEKRFYLTNQELSTSKVAIYTNLFSDFYSLIGSGSIENGWYTSIMKLPFIFCIWLGFFFGTIGGLNSLKNQLKKKKLNWL
uniref:Heme lyase n=1 Tax=Roya anglica TaxID=43943 RepID=A0A6G9IG24_9VIRI|nr:heme lyase [Roya anglica]QIQ22983.1 heme lyase [Roya anglica]